MFPLAFSYHFWFQTRCTRISPSRTSQGPLWQIRKFKNQKKQSDKSKKKRSRVKKVSSLPEKQLADAKGEDSQCADDDTDGVHAGDVHDFGHVEHYDDDDRRAEKSLFCMLNL